MTTLDMTKLLGLSDEALEAMKVAFDGANLQLIEAAIAVHKSKPGKAAKGGKAKAAPKEEEADEPVAKAAPKGKKKREYKFEPTFRGGRHLPPKCMSRDFYLNVYRPLMDKWAQDSKGIWTDYADWS